MDLSQVGSDTLLRFITTFLAAATALIGAVVWVHKKLDDSATKAADARERLNSSVQRNIDQLTERFLAARRDLLDRISENASECAKHAVQVDNLLGKVAGHEHQIHGFEKAVDRMEGYWQAFIETHTDNQKEIIQRLTRVETKIERNGK